MTMTSPWPILYEDNHLLVVVKPAMLPTMGVAEDRPSLLSQAKRYVKQKYGKPGNVYLGIVSRLDAPVTGLIVLARTSKAAARLTAQFRGQEVRKLYWAIVEGHAPSQEKLVDWVRKDERHRRMHIADRDARDAKEARLSYTRLQDLAGGTLLEVQLETGRKHQIRLQLSHAGYPILGDRKYGAKVDFAHGIGLHARRLAFEHPVRHTQLDLVAPLPPPWHKLGIRE